ncbi:MAG TPA: hypothetical protein VFA78_02980 [Chloroflexota bacterium]|nr:hypothetical protein [Chloroflexota bacterium]
MATVLLKELAENEGGISVTSPTLNRAAHRAGLDDRPAAPLKPDIESNFEGVEAVAEPLPVAVEWTTVEEKFSDGGFRI